MLNFFFKQSRFEPRLKELTKLIELQLNSLKSMVDFLLNSPDINENDLSLIESHMKDYNHRDREIDSFIKRWEQLDSLNKSECQLLANAKKTKLNKGIISIGVDPDNILKMAQKKVQETSSIKFCNII